MRTNDTITNNEMEIYARINQAVEEEKVMSYEDNIITFLRTHKQKGSWDSYFDDLQSKTAVGKGNHYIRYLAMGMDPSKIKLKEGILNAFSARKFENHWIETEDSVYDANFLGKWDKKAFYEIFKPIIVDERDITEDDEFLKAQANDKTIEGVDSKNPPMKYINWVAYYNSALIPNPFGMPLLLPWVELPKKKKTIKELVEEQWENSKAAEKPIPEELLSEELMTEIKKDEKSISPEELLLELVSFVTNNYETYEACKEIKADPNITLWKIACMKENRSGFLVVLLEKIPTIIKEIKKKKEIQQLQQALTEEKETETQPEQANHKK